MQNFKNKVLNIVFNPTIILTLGFQLLLTVVLYGEQFDGFINSLSFFLISTFSLFSLALIFDQLLILIPKRVIRVTLKLIFWILYLLMVLFHGINHSGLEWSLMSKYGLGLFTNADSREVIWGNIKLIHIVAILSLIIVIVFLEWKFKWLSEIKIIIKNKIKLLALILVFLGLSIFSTYFDLDEYTSFIKTIFHKVDITFSSDEAFPYLQRYSETEITSLKSFKETNPPNIFLVTLESFSSLFSNGHKENGKQITPFVDSLKHEGLFIENYFANSVETSKNQVSMFCSVIPAFTSNIFPNYIENNFKCLPNILKDYGYKTILTKGYRNLNFENTRAFALTHGFDLAYGMPANRFDSEVWKKHKWGWGIQDNLYYEEFFNILDSLKMTDSSLAKTKPIFATTMSISNHMNFDKVPQDQKYIFPDAVEIDKFSKSKSKINMHVQNFCNTMYLTDKYLRTFFEELKKRDWLDNSIVIITGDNGYPMGQHRNYNNGKNLYNEMFLTPMIILGKNIEKQKIKGPYSHLDLAPSIMDYLGIKTTNHFRGESFFNDTNNVTGFLPLIQPFQGGIVGSVIWPYKYILKTSSDKEYVYDLEKDSGEKRNIIIKIDKKLLAKLRYQAGEIIFNETLLKENRIFPANPNIAAVTVNLAKFEFEEKGLPLIITSEVKQDSFKVEAVIEYGESSKKERFKKIISDDNTVLPAEWFKDGLNLINLMLFDKNGNKLSSLNSEVFKKGPNIKLLSNMKISGKQSWGSLARNKSVKKNGMKVGNQKFNFGLGTHADSKYDIKLNQKWDIFSFRYGLDDDSQCGDGASFEVYVDNKRLFKSSKVGSELSPLEKIKISGAKKLTLITKMGNNRKCDHTDWINTILIKE